MKIPVSVLILTKDEERDIADCLRSVAWSDDVFVLDSGSSDSTQAIAKALGANVFEHPFNGYASQRNYGLGLPFRHPWVLILDADERIPDECAQEICDSTASVSSGVAGFRIRRRDIWWGKWLKHAQISPYFIRVVRVGRARYEREINEVIQVAGEVRDLRACFDHYPFSKGLDHWIAKHNQYSRMEAQVIASGLDIKPSIRKALLNNDFNEKRRHQKALFFRMPARPIIKFFYMMFVRGALLDGWPGVRYSILQSIYEYFIVLKTKEILSKSDMS